MAKRVLADRQPPPGFDYDTRGLSEYLNVPVHTLEDWRKKRINIPWLKLAGKVWYRKQDADDFLRRSTVSVLNNEQRRHA